MTGSTRGHNTTSSGTNRAQQKNTAHNSKTPGDATRSSAAQHRNQGQTAQLNTRHTAPGGSDENGETQKEGGGAATTGEQPTARREARKRRERTGSREVGGQQSKQRAALRPKAPGAGNQRKPERTGAHNAKNKKRTDHQAAGEGGAATTREQPTARRDTEKRDSARRAEERVAHKANKTQRQGPAHPGTETRESQRQRGRTQEKKGGTPSGSDETSQTQRKGGGGAPSTKEQPTAKQEKKTRAHGEPRGGRKKKSKAQRQGPRHPGPETRVSERQRRRGQGRKKQKNHKEQSGQAKQKVKAAKEKGEAHQKAPRRPARPTRPRRGSTRTHARDPGVASSDPQAGGVGVHTKQPPCTGRVPRRTTDGPRNQTRQ